MLELRSFSEVLFDAGSSASAPGTYPGPEQGRVPRWRHKGDKFRRELSPSIAQKGMDTLRSDRTQPAGTPKSRSSVTDSLRRDRGKHHIGVMPACRPASHQTHPRCNPISRSTHGRLAYSRCAHMRGWIGTLPSLPPTSRGAWRRDVNRIKERIVALMSSATRVFVIVG